MQLPDINQISKRDLRKICVDRQIPDWSKPDARGKQALYDHVANYWPKPTPIWSREDLTPTMSADSQTKLDDLAAFPVPPVDGDLQVPADPIGDWIEFLNNLPVDPRDRDESDWPSATWPLTCELPEPEEEPVELPATDDETGELTPEDYPGFQLHRRKRRWFDDNHYLLEQILTGLFFAIAYIGLRFALVAVEAPIAAYHAGQKLGAFLGELKARWHPFEGLATAYVNAWM